MIEYLRGLAGLALLLGIGGWVLYRWFKRSDDPMGLAFRWAVTVPVAGFVVYTAATAQDDVSKIFAIFVGLAGGMILAVIWGSLMVDFVAKQFMNLYTGGDEAPEPRPQLSIAEGMRCRGEYPQAIAEVRSQLETFSNDYTAWMMLAEIQAENLKDVPAAQATIEHLLELPGQTAANLAYALNRLADWHLELARDAGAAAAAIRQIRDRFPDTEQAFVAGQRLAHFEGTAAQLVAKENRAPVPVPHNDEYLGLRDDFAGLTLPEEDPGVTNARLVAQLEKHPQDCEARELLARLYAERLHRPDLAVDQLEQLIALPHAPERWVVHWLNLLADIQIRDHGDREAAQCALERVLDRYPESPVTEQVCQRIAHLNLELRAKQKSQVLRLGSYEENIGLKTKA